MSSTMHKIGEKLGLSHDHTEGTTGSSASAKQSSHSSAPAFEPESGQQTSSSGSAPVVKERIHEQAEHVDKTNLHEQHEKTKVHQVVQPLKDQQQEGTRHRTEDHGTEVHEHGHGGLDANAKRKLEQRRADIAKQGGTTIDRSENSTSERPDVDRTQKTHHVEEVIPVVEKDVYKPERVEHRKEQVEIVHDKPQVEGLTVNKPMDVSDYRNQQS